MQWVPVTLASGKASVVDFSTVMYATEHFGGTRLHFQHEAFDASGKPLPHCLNITQSLDVVIKSLKGRKLF